MFLLWLCLYFFCVQDEHSISFFVYSNVYYFPIWPGKVGGMTSYIVFLNYFPIYTYGFCLLNIYIHVSRCAQWLSRCLNLFLHASLWLSDKMMTVHFFARLSLLILHYVLHDFVLQFTVVAWRLFLYLSLSIYKNDHILQYVFQFSKLFKSIYICVILI